MYQLVAAMFMISSRVIEELISTSSESQLLLLTASGEGSGPSCGRIFSDSKNDSVQTKPDSVVGGFLSLMCRYRELNCAYRFEHLAGLSSQQTEIHVLNMPRYMMP